MTRRFFATLSALAVVVALPSVAARGQTAGAATGKAKTSTPRTSDGRPDLQGTWDFRTITPLERPSELGGKQVLTDEEVAQIEERAAGDRIDRPPRVGDPGTYNQFWFDRGTKVIGDRRTSLIVDPPNGRIPPLAPAAQIDGQGILLIEGHSSPAANQVLHLTFE